MNREQNGDKELIEALKDGAEQLDEILRMIGRMPEPERPGESTYDRMNRLEERRRRIENARHHVEVAFLVSERAITG